ncbi:MAG: hypothetical protein MJY94_00270 [Bacteroidales bacterium]|nr:hypothetical protein [Bacteroidales bacterium]
MKRLLSTAIGLLLACTSISAQTHEAHLGSGLSMYDILGVPYQNGIESVGPAFNLGYKYLKPLKGGLQWYAGADVYGRSIHFEGPWYVGVNTMKENVGCLVNIPVGAGLRYGFPISEKFSAYADLGLGLNVDLGHEVGEEGHAIIGYNPYNGLPIEKDYQRMMYNKGFRVENSFSGILSLIHDFPSTLSTFFTFELGTVYGNHWSLGLSYANFGLVEVEKYQRLIAASFVPGSEMESEMMSSHCSGHGTMALSSLSLRLGYVF